MLTSVQITDDDWKFVKEKKLKFSDLMREAIFQHRQIEAGVLIDNISELKTQREYYKKTAMELKEVITEMEERALKNGK